MNWQKLSMFYSNRFVLLLTVAMALVIFSKRQSLASVNETERKYVGYVKVGPLKQMIKQITNIAYQIQPSPAVESLPYLVGIMLGDPSLHSISVIENTTVFIYDTLSDRGATYLVLVKLTEDSPIHNALSRQGMIIENRKGWSLISSDQFLLDQIKDVEPLIKFTQEKRGTDIEIGFLLDHIKYPVEYIKDEIINRSEKEGYIKDETDRTTIEGLIDIIIGELRTLESLLMGIDITPDKFVIQSNIKAISGTPLGRLFSQELVRDIPMGKYLSTKTSLTYRFRFNPKDSGEYVNHILDAVADVSQNDWKSLVINLKDFYKEFLGGIDGTSVGSFEMNKMTIKRKQLGGTDLSSSEFADLIEEGIKLTDELMKIISKDNRVEITLFHNFKRDAFTVNEVSVHTLKSRFNNMDNFLSGEEFEEEKSVTDQTYYYAVNNGVYFNASDRKSIYELIKQVTSGRPADRNINTVFSYKEGIIGQLRIDPRYSLMKMIENRENIKPELVEAIHKKIELTVIDPILSEFRIGNSRLSVNTKASWKSVADWVSIIQMINRGSISKDLPIFGFQ